MPKSINTIKELGHAAITTTVDTYGHVLPAARRAASDAIERLLTGTEWEPGAITVNITVRPPNRKPGALSRPGSYSVNSLTRRWGSNPQPAD